jgi:hypothetical protein
MKKASALLFLSATFLLSSCASYGPMGSWYTSGTTGLSANNDVRSDKTGKACMTSIIGIVATGDASIASAKANGKITKVATVDYNVHNILGVYGKYCTVVTGE